MFIYIYMYYTTTCKSPCVTICEPCIALYPHVHAQSKFIYIYIYYTATCMNMCQHLWTLLCEHYCVNMHLWIASLNPLYPACPCTMQVYLHLHPLHCHLHITMHQHLLTMCEHYCVNMHLWIASLNPLYPACPCTKQVYLHLLHCHLHITMCHHLWTLLYEHVCVNCFFKCTVPFMSL